MSVQQRHWIRARGERGTAHMIADHSERFAHRGAHLPTAQPPGGDSSTVGSVHRRPPATNTFCAAPCAPSRHLSRQQGAKSDANRWQSCGWPASMRGSEAAELLHAGVSKHKVALRMRATPLQPAGRHHSDKKKCEPRDRRMHSLSSVLVDIPPHVSNPYYSLKKVHVGLLPSLLRIYRNERGPMITVR